MDCNVYICRDKVSNNTVAIFNAVNDGMAIRDNAQFLARIVPLNDMELYHVANFFDKDNKIIPLPEFRAVNWNSYKFPDSRIVNNASGSSPVEVRKNFENAVADLASKVK